MTEQATLETIAQQLERALNEFQGLKGQLMELKGYSRKWRLALRVSLLRRTTGSCHNQTLTNQHATIKRQRIIFYRALIGREN
jgi:hypothetical protein